MKKVKSLNSVFSKTVAYQSRLIKDVISSSKGFLATKTMAGALFKTDQVSKLKALPDSSKAWLNSARKLELKKGVYGAAFLTLVGAGLQAGSSSLYNKGKNFNLKTEAFGKRGSDSAGMLGQAGLEGLKFKPLKNRKYI